MQKKKSTGVDIDLLSYQTYGSFERPAVVFLHGFMGRSDDWQKVVAGLENEYLCVTIDLPGHGDSLSLPEHYYQFENAAQCVINVLDMLQLTAVNLVGYSMGGRLAIYLLHKFADRFISACIESASPGLKTELQRAERITGDHHLAGRLQRENYATFLQWWYALPLFAKLQNHPDYPKLIQRRLKNNPVELSRALAAMSTGRQPNLWPTLQRTNIPVMMVVGEHDLKYVEIGKEMTHICRLIQLRKLARCGHNTHFEKSADFNSILKDFLEKR